MALKPTQDLSSFKVYSEDKELPGTFNIISIIVERSINRVPGSRELLCAMVILQLNIQMQQHR